MKLRNSRYLPIVAIMASVALGLVYTVAKASSPVYGGIEISFFAVGIIFLVFSLFIKEKWLYNAAIPMFVIFILLSCHALCSGSVENYAYAYRYTDFGAVRVSTLLFLPLTVCFIAKLITMRRRFNLLRMFIISGFAVVIFAVLFLETQLHAAAVCAVAAVIVYCTVCRDRKLTGPFYHRLVIPGIGLLCVVLFLLTARSYTIERIMLSFDVIFNRDGMNPMAEGWTRNLYDSLIASSVFSGQAENFEYFSEMYLLGDSNILVMLMNYGWIAVIGIFILLAVLLGIMWLMTFSIKNKPFARYVSLISVIVLTLQTLYAVISVFFLTSAHIDIPFAGCSKSVNLVSYLLLGLVITCFWNREKTEGIHDEALYINNIVPFEAAEEKNIYDIC